jgi:hypothetical protein
MLSCLGSNSSQKLAVGIYATEARNGTAARAGMSILMSGFRLLTI